MPLHVLTAREVQAAGDGDHADGGGLILRVRAAGCLAPIVELASCLDCAAFGVSHFSKGTAGRDPVERVTGSLAFGAVARVVLVAARIKEDNGPECRLLARAKSNIGPDNGGFAYALEQVPVRDHPGILASRVTWGTPIEGTARELLADAEAIEEAGADALDAAKWLRELLEDGPMPQKSVAQAAKEAGFSMRSVQRAKKKAGVTSGRDGFGKGARYVWRHVMRATETPCASCAPAAESGVHGTHDGADAKSDDLEVF